MKVYISGKISDLHVDDFTRSFKKAEEELRRRGHEPVNPVELNHDHTYADSLPTKHEKWCYYMDIDMQALIRCEAIYMLNNWQTSRGARVERAIAFEMGLQIIYQQ